MINPLTYIRLISLTTLALALIAVLASCGSKPSITPRTDIIKATRPASLPPIDPKKVSRGVTNVGKGVVTLSTHTAVVSRYNERLREALKRGAAKEELESLVAFQAEEISARKKVEKWMQEHYDKLLEDYDNLLASIAKDNENDKAIEKHGDATIGALDTTEKEKSEAIKWKAKNQHKVDTYDKVARFIWIIGIGLVLAIAIFFYFGLHKKLARFTLWPKG